MGSARSADISILPATTHFSPAPSPLPLASTILAGITNSRGQAEHVLNQLMNLGLPPTQPLALFERMLCTVRPGATLTAQDTESLVVLLVKSVAQFVQLQSQLSQTHQQILRLAANTKHAGWSIIQRIDFNNLFPATSC